MGENKKTMLEISVFLVALGYLSWRFFFKPRKRRHKRYESSDYKKASKWHNKRDFENKQKGDNYEFQISKYYKNKGYKIYPNGINKGVADGGIDIVAHKGSETILIQCKNWEYSQIKQEHLRIFLGDCTAYIERNQKYLAKRKIRRVFITSCQNIDYGVERFVAENNVEYKIVSYKKR